MDGSITVTARVLLDSASQRTFMTNRLAKQLKLIPQHKELSEVFVKLEETKEPVVPWSVESLRKAIFLI